MRANIRGTLIALLLALIWCGTAKGQAIEAVTVSGLDNQIYVGYEYTHFDYELLTPQGDNQVLHTTGVNAQYNYRGIAGLRITGRGSYGSGATEGQKLLTVAAGGGLTGPIWRLEPYVEVLGGMSRLTSTDNIYLSTGPISSFTYILSGGVDYTLRGRLGIRPIYVELQHLSFGPNGSTYVSTGGGILYRFGSRSFARHRNGR